MAIYALVFVVFASVGASMIGVIIENTDWMAVGGPVATAPADPDDHPMGIPETGIPEGVIVADDPGDRAMVLHFDDGQTPRIFDDGAFGSRLGVGGADAPPGFAPSSSVGTHANRGRAIDLFLAADDEPNGAIATTPPGATTVISRLRVAFAENAPIYDLIPIASIEPRETSAALELGRKDDPPRRPGDFAR